MPPRNRGRNMGNLAYIKSLKVLLITTVVANLAFGQGLTGSINGTVTDQSGSAIVGAEITLTNVGTSQTRQTTSDTNGDFVFTQLLPGTFRVVVTGEGFKRYEENSVIVPSAERLVLNRIELQLGDITQTIEVQADTPLLQTHSADPARPLSPHQHHKL